MFWSLIRFGSKPKPPSAKPRIFFTGSPPATYRWQVGNMLNGTPKSKFQPYGHTFGKIEDYKRVKKLSKGIWLCTTSRKGPSYLVIQRPLFPNVMITYATPTTTSMEDGYYITSHTTNAGTKFNFENRSIPNFDKIEVLNPGVHLGISNHNDETVIYLLLEANHFDFPQSFP